MSMTFVVAMFSIYFFSFHTEHFLGSKCVEIGGLPPPPPPDRILDFSPSIITLWTKATYRILFVLVEVFIFHFGGRS